MEAWRRACVACVLLLLAACLVTQGTVLVQSCFGPGKELTLPVTSLDPCEAILLCNFTVPFNGAIAAWLISIATTPFLKCAARLAVGNWVYEALWEATGWAFVLGPPPMVFTTTVCFFSACLRQLVQYESLRMTRRRVAALETGMGNRVRIAERLKRLIWTTLGAQYVAGTAAVAPVMLFQMLRLRYPDSYAPLVEALQAVCNAVFAAASLISLLTMAAITVQAAIFLHATRCAMCRVVEDMAPGGAGRRLEDARMAAKVLSGQLWGTILMLGSTTVTSAGIIVAGVFMQHNARASAMVFFIAVSMESWLNALGALLWSGALTNASRKGWEAKVAQERRILRRGSILLRPVRADQRWLEKADELAGRGFTLEALMAFWRGLGKKYMLHFDAALSTTEDVVRAALIPMSRERRCAYAHVMMQDKCVRPMAMVTHSWSSLWRDTVAAILSDALGEAEYDLITAMIEDGFDELEAWVHAAGVGARAYWLCAICVNQHAGICGQNPYKSKDTVTGLEHATCCCGLEKIWNETEPLDGDGRSLACEMNKFSTMMEILSANDPSFYQIIAVDAKFRLFTRAWCVAEIATAHKRGMHQVIKVESATGVDTYEPLLRSIRIQDTQASRVEDLDEILRMNSNHDRFNRDLQSLLFDDLFPEWMHLDVSTQLDRVGRIIRWQTAAFKYGKTRMIYHI